MGGLNVQTFRFISFQYLVRYDIRSKLCCVSLEKWRTLFKAIISQFQYCPLVWMFDGRQISHKINTLHELALWIVQNDYVSSFQDLRNNNYYNCLQLLTGVSKSMMITCYQVLQSRGAEGASAPSTPKVLRWCALFCWWSL